MAPRPQMKTFELHLSRISEILAGPLLEKGDALFRRWLSRSLGGSGCSLLCIWTLGAAVVRFPSRTNCTAKQGLPSPPPQKAVPMISKPSKRLPDPRCLGFPSCTSSPFPAFALLSLSLCCTPMYRLPTSATSAQRPSPPNAEPQLPASSARRVLIRLFRPPALFDPVPQQPSQCASPTLHLSRC
jgi:hypothetical protein